MQKNNMVIAFDNERLSKIENTLNSILERLDKLPEPDDIMTAKEAAAYLKLSMTSIYEKTSKGKIPFLKSGGSLVFSKAELNAWLKAGRPDLMDKAIENL